MRLYDPAVTYPVQVKREDHEGQKLITACCPVCHGICAISRPGSDRIALCSDDDRCDACGARLDYKPLYTEVGWTPEEWASRENGEENINSVEEALAAINE
jgi:hypothetical protein